MTKTSFFLRAGALCAALLPLLTASAFAQAARDGSRPLNLTDTDTTSGPIGGGGGNLVRTIVGLAIVIAVIYGITWVLRQVKASRELRAVGGLQNVATVPLGSGRALHLVRAGNELVLVGAAEHGVTPVRTYTEQEARDAGLIDEWGDLIQPEALVPAASAAGSTGTGSKLAQMTPRNLVEAARRRTVRR
jgi:flagellar protein FliO/FliZ